jgi:hypothetical protein
MTKEEATSMKKFGLRVVLYMAANCMAVGFPFYAHADGCEYDTQCKGDRICENKICVAPPPASHAATSQAAAAAAPVAKPVEHSAGFLGIFNKPPAQATNATYFCCTMSEKLGPFPNPESDGKTYQIGEACAGTTTSARHFSGKVCN